MQTPDILTFHLNRSSHFGNGGAFKNSARVNFPEHLDLCPFSDHPDPGAKTPDSTPRELYRLASLVEHYGSHSFGHYVAYRRRPVAPPPSGTSPRLPPEDAASQEADGDTASTSFIPDVRPPTPEWLHISDETVSAAHLNDALRANPFLIFYERVRTVPGVDPSVISHRPDSPASLGEKAEEEERVVPRVVQSWSLPARRHASPPVGEPSKASAATMHTVEIAVA